MAAIMSDELKISDLPSGRINWHKLSRFALTFDPVAENVTDEEGLAISKMQPNEAHNIRELRGFLYNFQRLWNQRTYEPSINDWKTVEMVMIWIREKLQ